MTMDRQKGQIVFMCDECDTIIETVTRDFDEARAYLRANGWQAHTEDGETWTHTCESCGGPL